jgi:hypothetical protein
MVRWQTELAFLRTEAYTQASEPEWACQQLEHAWGLMQITHSTVQKQYWRTLYQGLASRYPNQRHIRQLAMLATA